MTKDEALKLALEALEWSKPHADAEITYNDAITAIKEALAQPEQEPVEASKKDKVFDASIEFIGSLTGMTPPPIEVAPPEVFKPFRDFTEKVCSIFATPPQRKPLTNEQARSEFEAWHKNAYTQSLERYGHTYKNHHTRCRWQGWLAAHGIKGEA